MVRPFWARDRGVMDDHHQAGNDAAFLVSGATLDDESVGPLYADSIEAHAIARKAIAGVGGTVRILRGSADGWLEVARYTDTGRHATRSGISIDWAKIEFADGR